ncbi:MAG: hypothetical protein IPH77_05535 [Ignavibacteria bacterium]|nr:hypothetical protein [Ignavibacteria bacterium]
MSGNLIRIFSAIILFNSYSFSQNKNWENYTDLKIITSVTADTDSHLIFCASKGGLFSVDAITGKVIKKYTNLDGLISNDLTSLTVDNKRRLWVGASDGSISVLDLSNGSWKYIFDIKNSNESNKSINYLFLSGNFMYVATGYGIQKISVNNFSFVDAPYYKLGIFPINTIVYALTVSNNVLYAATKTGIAYANFITSNLNDPGSWTNYSAVPMNADVKTIESAGDKIFAGSTGGCRYFDGNDWLPYPNPVIASTITKSIKVISSNIYFITDTKIYTANVNSLSEVSEFLSQNNYSVLGSYNNSVPVAGLSDNGIIISSLNPSAYIFPNSPFSNVFNHLAIDSDNNVWAAGGLVNNGFYKYNGSEWENYNLSTHPEIGNSNWFQKMVLGNGNVWALGFGGGPTIINGNSITNFNPSNSILPGISNNPMFCVPYGGAYDQNGVLWLSFFGTNSGSSLYAYTGNNNWIAFQNPSTITSATLSEVAIDSYNTKWIASGGSRSGVYYFNENTTLNNSSDDISGFYSNSDFGSEITNIYDVIVDKNNEVWIATNNGIFIINNPYGAIQNPSQKPPAIKLGIISGNLRVPFTENCISLTNDILNDKWIGTETNGVFHLSSDGSTLIEQFNSNNTPLLQNQIKTIAVSNKTGRAYFGTNSGLSSYLTNAIEPVAEFGDITFSPNPYLIPSDVNLKIDGLIENSIVKIINVSGEIITEFDSPGGRIAVWNGLNKNNELVPTGIYIVVAYNKDGSKAGKGKVAVVRK